MRFFQEANNSIKTAFITYAVTLIATLSTIFLFFQGMMDIPLGILLGGSLFGTLSLLSGFLEKKDEDRKTPIYSIVLIGVRFLLLIAVTIVIAFMYYRWNLPIFNVFAFVGAYTVSIIIMIIVYLIYK